MATHERAKRRLVVFLGAGFSAQYGIPTMAKIVDYVRENKLLDKADEEEFDRIHAQCDQFASVIGESARNLEQLASFLSILDFSWPDYRFPGCDRYALPKDALRLIQEILQKTTNPPRGIVHKNSQLPTCLPLSIDPKIDLTVVTTNYDLLVEMHAAVREVAVIPSKALLDDPNFRIKKDAPLVYRHPREVTTNAPCIRLFKLHGSVNWNTPAETAEKLYVDRYFRYSLLGEIHPTTHFLQLDDTKPSDTPPLTPLIVPPVVVKHSQFPPVIAEQWRGAREALSNADQIWFIGYSFPETDTFIRFFLGSAIADNPRLKQIAIVDPDPAVFERAQRDVFCSPRVLEILKLLPVPWGEVEYRQLLDMNDILPVSPMYLRIKATRLKDQAILDDTLLSVVDDETRPTPRRGSRSRGRRSR